MKKSKWVRCRDNFFNGLKSLFTKVVGFIRSDPELRRIFKFAGERILEGIKSLEGNTTMSGPEKLSAVRAMAIETLRRAGIEAGKQAINTAVEMLLRRFRDR